MSSFFVSFINKLKLNPIASAAFTLALTCIGFWFNYEINYAETQERFERNYVEISSLDKELVKAESIIEIWRAAVLKNDSLIKSIEFMNQPTYVLKKQDVSQFVVMMANSRKSLDNILIQTSSTRFDNKNLSDIILDINTDAIHIDNFLKEHLEFIILVFEDRKKAESKKEKYKSTIEGYRKFAEIDARLVNIDNSYDKVVVLHNSLVRIDKEQRNRQKFKSNFVILCWIYIGGYIGYWLGFVVRKFRKKTPLIPKPTESIKKENGS